MPAALDKSALRDAIVRKLESEHAGLAAAAKSSKDEATSEENKPEGTHDMRGQLAAYLAEGQARVAESLFQAISAYRRMPLIPVSPGNPASVGSIVTLESQGREMTYFVGPAHGGMEIDMDGVTVTVITAGSPLGRELVGRREGERVRTGKIAAIG